MVDYIQRALIDLCGNARSVLDWGCGMGQLVTDLNTHGFDALGCDQNPYWRDDQGGRLRAIEKPYRLPFDSNSFDAVVSTSVLEHAGNKGESFREVHRVLKPGGYALHIFPSKWYFPTEPHMYVPLANFLWPHIPRAWFGLWALAGIRNEFQSGLGWRDVVEKNAAYSETGISYWTNGRYESLSMNIFGNYTWPMEHFIEHSAGGFAKLARKLPLKRASGYLCRNLRMAVLLNRKN